VIRFSNLKTGLPVSALNEFIGVNVMPYGNGSRAHARTPARRGRARRQRVRPAAEYFTARMITNVLVEVNVALPESPSFPEWTPYPTTEPAVSDFHVICPVRVLPPALEARAERGTEFAACLREAMQRRQCAAADARQL
jgi:hypothetical protein